jgi:phosphoribosyl 1,2-cyclic phosphate phosphodiesterase
MTIFFLGTGAAEGFPAIFSDDPINLEARRRGGKDLRTRSTILIDQTIKIDLPPDTLFHVFRYPSVHLARLKHLLFTHSHDDHFAVRELQYLSPNFAPDRTEPLHVWATDELIRKMYTEMGHFFEPSPLLFHAVAPFSSYNVGALKVTPITAHHKHDELCLNYLLEKDGKRVLYASDTGWYDEPTWNFLEKTTLDLVILECGKGVSDNTYDGHMNLDECVRFREKLIASGTLETETPVYLTHICHTGLLLHDEMVEHAALHGLLVAYDGLELEV